MLSGNRTLINWLEPRLALSTLPASLPSSIRLLGSPVLFNLFYRQMQPRAVLSKSDSFGIGLFVFLRRDKRCSFNTVMRCRSNREVKTRQHPPNDISGSSEKLSLSLCVVLGTVNVLKTYIVGGLVLKNQLDYLAIIEMQYFHPIYRVVELFFLIPKKLGLERISLKTLKPFP